MQTTACSILENAFQDLQERGNATALSCGMTSVIDVVHALRTVVDPELGINLVDLGLVYNVAVEGDVASVELTMTSPACPLSEYNPQIAKNPRPTGKISQVAHTFSASTRCKSYGAGIAESRSSMLSDASRAGAAGANREGRVQMMLRTIGTVAIFMVAFVGGSATAQEKPKIVTAPAPQVDPTDAPAMFRAYCAACHGAQARGDGPAAPALKATPADLTRISARNGGKFPTPKVRRYIEGLDEIAAHGSRDMPVWGQALRGVPGGQAGVQLRIEALTRYLESIQVK
jgi:mono/diheme cytochrome c family protein